IGGAGQDTLEGMDGNDALYGGAGNDLLVGGTGSDTYYFGRGDGQDTIIGMPFSPGERDRIQLGAGLSRGDIKLGAQGADLLLQAGEDMLTVRDYLALTLQDRPDVFFADGSVWAKLELDELARPHSPALSTPLLDITTAQDVPFSYALTGVFTDQDAADVLSYSVTLLDGAPLPGWLSFDSATLVLAGKPKNADVGELDIRVVATDKSGFSISDAFHLKVLNINDAPLVLAGIPDINAKEAAVFSYVLPADAFKDLDAGDRLTLSATLVGGLPLPSWLSFKSDTGTFIGTPPTGSAGSLELVVTATDIAGASVSDMFRLAISEAITTVAGTGVADVLTGTSGADVLYGFAGNDTLNGGDGRDVLDGGAGSDLMTGGSGDDTYVVDASGDRVIEGANGGIDLVQSSINYTLGNNLENLTLLGTSGLSGAGNGLDNRLIGNAGANQLTGGAGSDLLDGGAGRDTLVGGVGNDTYMLNRGSGLDTVAENDSTAGNADVLQTGADIAATQLWFARNGNNLEVSIIGTADKMVVSNWYSGSPYHVEQFKSGDGKVLIDSQVNALVSAMASFAPPVAGQTTLPSTYQASLNAVIAANWK
ncbi:putative Ig domain-containing protein, partial [Uliginosibacterium paludis]